MTCRVFRGAGEETLGKGWKVLDGRGGYGIGTTEDEWRLMGGGWMGVAGYAGFA
jgi:hypothetical protein